MELLPGPTSSAAGAARLLPAATVAATVGGCLVLHWRRGTSSSGPAQQAAEPTLVPDPEPGVQLHATEDARICKHWRKRGSFRRQDGSENIHPEEVAPLADAERSGRSEGHCKRQETAAPATTAGFNKGARLRLEGEQRFRAVVQYDGTDYDGWQTQPHGRTIQDELEQRLGSVLLGRGKRIAVAGSGRTDAGVHATAQVFHFECPRDHWTFKGTKQNGAPKTLAELTAERLQQVMQHGTHQEKASLD